MMIIMIDNVSYLSLASALSCPVLPLASQGQCEKAQPSVTAFLRLQTRIT